MSHLHHQRSSRCQRSSCPVSSETLIWPAHSSHRQKYLDGVKKGANQMKLNWKLHSFVIIMQAFWLADWVMTSGLQGLILIFIILFSIILWWFHVLSVCHITFRSTENESPEVRSVSSFSHCGTSSSLNARLSTAYDLPSDKTNPHLTLFYDSNCSGDPFSSHHTV